MARIPMSFRPAAPLLLAALAGFPLPANAQEGDLRGIGYDRGRRAAPVAVIEFGDFGCTSCGQFARETLPMIREEFIATGKVFWKYVPFVLGAFPNGEEAARAAECAANQSRFWEMHDRLFADQTTWIDEGDPREVFVRYASDLGLDASLFERCYREDGGEDRTDRANDAADDFRVRGTPTFFINGRRVEGALPGEQFRQLLAEAVSASS